MRENIYTCVCDGVYIMRCFEMLSNCFNFYVVVCVGCVWMYS